MLELLRRRSAAGEARSPSDTESTLAPTAPPTAAASTPRGAPHAPPLLGARCSSSACQGRRLAVWHCRRDNRSGACCRLLSCCAAEGVPLRPHYQRARPAVGGGARGCAAAAGRGAGAAAGGRRRRPLLLRERRQPGGWVALGRARARVSDLAGRTSRAAELTACPPLSTHTCECVLRAPPCHPLLQSSSDRSGGGTSCSCSGSGSEAGSDGEDERSPQSAAGAPRGGGSQQQQQHPQQQQQPCAGGTQPNGSASPQQQQRQRRNRGWHRQRRGRGGAASATSSGGGAEIPAGPVPLRLRRRSEAGSVLEPEGHSETEDAELAGPGGQEPISEVEAEPSSPC